MQRLYLFVEAYIKAFDASCYHFSATRSHSFFVYNIAASEFVYLHIWEAKTMYYGDYKYG